MLRRFSFLLAVPLILCGHAASAVTFLVTTNGDSGPGSLRQAILDANATPGPDTIHFRIEAGPQRIQLATALPIITDTVDIDGTTQPGFSNRPVIEIVGFFTIPRGLDFVSGSNVVRSLAINSFASTKLNFQGSGGNLIVGNFLGLNLAGDYVTIAGASGIALQMSAGNQIGLHGFGNVISGNGAFGVLINGSSNVVEGNLIGTDPSGTAVRGNQRDGIRIGAGGSWNTISGNVISGNSTNGIFLTGAPFNVIEGNYIGCDPTGKVPIPNRLSGINVFNSSDLTIGGGTAAARNVISGNSAHGIEIVGVGSSNIVVQGNYIGVDVSGLARVANGGSGVFLNSTAYNLVGSAEAGTGNVISGNLSNGVLIAGSHSNIIAGNHIGCDATGTAPIGNQMRGISIGVGLPVNSAVANSLIGNVVSGNLSDGIALARGSNNLVAANFVGTDATGMKAVGNGGHGMFVVGAANTIGGTDPADRNVVSGNANSGIQVSGGTGNVIQGNYIGSNSRGNAALPNRVAGVYLTGAANGTTIGGSEPGAGNLISGNGGGEPLIGAGVVIVAANTTNNVVHGNRIGTDAAGQFPLPNKEAGVRIDGARWNHIGGVSPGEGNLIAFNSFDGVVVDFEAAGNPILGNAIHSNGRLGINLKSSTEADGVVTANDANDADTGPNNLQNFPVITNVVYLTDSTIIQGYLRSSTNGSFSIDVYANVATEQSGYGEGQFYLGNVDVDTDENGFTEFAFSAGSTFSNQFFTATALNYATSDTSEFSAAMGGLRITSIRRISNTVEVRFTTVAGRTYHLERATSLNPPITWTTVATPATIFGTGGEVSVFDSAPATGARFYRAVLQPLP